MSTKLINSSSVATIDPYNRAPPSQRPGASNFLRENVRSTIQPEMNALSPNIAQKGIKVNTSPHQANGHGIGVSYSNVVFNYNL
jgi:hypothetical protein